MKNMEKIVWEILQKHATLFPNQEALDKYLKDHPEADKSKHKVVKQLGESKSKIKFTNYKELRDAQDFLKNKMKGISYEVPGDEKHIHFLNHKGLQDALKHLKDKKKDKFIEKIYSK